MTTAPVNQVDQQEQAGARNKPRVSRERVQAAVLPLVLLALILLAWSLMHEGRRFLPSPLEVAAAVPDFVTAEGVLSGTISTMVRVLGGLAIAMVLAVVSALLMVADERLNRLLETYVLVTFGIPGLAAALFSLMVFGLSELGVYAAVAVVTYPFATVALRDGAKQVDRRLLDMSHVFHFTGMDRLRHIVLPTISPSFFATLRNMHALSWKIAIIAEVFLNRDGIGGEFRRAFDNFQLESVLLWLGVFLIALFSVEYGVLRPVERHIYRWRH